MHKAIVILLGLYFSTCSGALDRDDNILSVSAEALELAKQHAASFQNPSVLAKAWNANQGLRYAFDGTDVIVISAVGEPDDGTLLTGISCSTCRALVCFALGICSQRRIIFTYEALSLVQGVISYVLTRNLCLGRRFDTTCPKGLVWQTAPERLRPVGILHRKCTRLDTFQTQRRPGFWGDNFAGPASSPNCRGSCPDWVLQIQPIRCHCEGRSADDEVNAYVKVHYVIKDE